MRTLLLAETVPLLTLTGPGGVGKTRLALQVAAEAAPAYADGVIFVPLAASQDPELVLPAIAQALQLRASPGLETHALLIMGLRDRQMLLVLDNLEQVLPVAPALADLLNACPRLQILATSRTRLHLDLEHRFPVPPLAIPGIAERDTTETLLANPAVALFVDRCRQHAPHLEWPGVHAPTVATIVRRLEGMPLAIELAAARIGILSPDAILARLDQQLALLADGPANAPARLRSMRNTVAWSYDLLQPETQRLFRHLAVFRGGFTLHAAQDIASNGADPFEEIAHLVANSLIQADGDVPGDPRYTMLESLREFGQEQLQAAGEWDDVRARHAAWFLAFVERTLPDPALPGDLQRIAPVIPEHDNIRLALEWFATTGAGEDLARLAATLLDFWFSQGLYREGRTWLQRAFELADTAAPPVRLRLLGAAGALALVAGDLAEAERLSAEELPLARASGNSHHLVVALFNAGLLAQEYEDFAAAERLMWEARELARSWGNTRAGQGTVGTATANLAATALSQGSFTHARALLDESIALLKDLDYPWGFTFSLFGLGEVHLHQGAFLPAARAYAAALAQARLVNDPAQAPPILLGVAAIAAACGNLDSATLLLAAAEDLAATLRRPHSLADLAIRDLLLSRLRDDKGRLPASGSSPTGSRVSLAQSIEAATRIVHELITQASAVSANAAGLTSREREILHLLDHGWTDRQIAETLFLSRKTVSNHVSNILSKLEAPSRQDAAQRGRSLGLLP